MAAYLDLPRELDLPGSVEGRVQIWNTARRALLWGFDVNGWNDMEHEHLYAILYGQRVDEAISCASNACWSQQRL
ncbi:hypothetical protein [Paraburkholderia mimosarum]|uniref:hypothetical protein n=1 Tax=Paraburkholderia mimosarum TaxID=312026 RepID=UPI000409EDF6|nr:hypothetical protein [Paraburkholderia mimosarum]